MIVFALEFARLEQLFELVSGAQCLLFFCMLQVWSNHTSLSVVSRDCYLLVFRRSGASIHSCQWSLVIVILLYVVGLEQLFDLVGRVQ